MEIISNPFSDLGNLLAKKLNSLANIHESFLIPPEFKLAELLSNQESPSFKNRPNLFTFPGEAYEFHADTPTFLVKIFSFDTAKHLALVTPVKYYHNIIKTREQVPVFCVNSSDILVAYNRPFNNLIVDSTQEQPLLGATIGRLFEPTPEKNARAILESLILPHFKRVNINDTKTVSDRTTHISVNHVFDWNLDDIKLDIEMDNIDNLPPCIIFGDSFVESIPFTDINAYLIGPTPGGNGFVIKKGGETSESIYMDKGSLKSKVFSFIKTGNNFILMNGEQRIFGFHDPAMLRRTTGDLTIYLRPGSKYSIKDMKLSVHHRDIADPPINRFVNFNKSPNKFFLLSPVRRFELDEKNGVYAAYELLDLSDMKQKIDQVTEANKRLQNYSNRSRLMVGESKVLSTVIERAEKLAASNATVLIEGATGTGKELMAQYIHTSSSRSAGPFLKVDCSTIPSSLIESSLFGHEKGAFTGATTRIRGLFEQADGGTLFIDEAGNLTMDVQAKLLQFLENRTFSPLGGVKSLTVDVRVIVASNLSLATLVKTGSFREDLFHRIAVFIVTMPNLSDRLEDIPSLANHFLTELNRKYKKGIRYISADVYRKLNQHNWSGNIRELKNVLERAYFFTEDEKISEIDIENYNVTNKESNNRKKRTNLSFLKEKPELLISTANKHNGNLTATAAELGIAHRTLYSYIKKNNIEPDMLRHQ